MGWKKLRAGFIIYLLLFVAVNLVLVERWLYRRQDEFSQRPEVKLPKNWDRDLLQKVTGTIRGEKELPPKKMPQPLISCPQIRNRIKLDGELDDEMWHQAGIAENFIVYEGKVKRLAKKKTKIYLMYDRRNLYVGFICKKAPVKYFRPIGKRKIRERWAKESLGILINNSKKDDSYYQFGVNLDGTTAEAFKEDIKWLGRWRVKTSCQNNCWVGEIAIPFSSLGGKRPGIGDSWKINFYRRYDKKHLSLWHGDEDNYICPESFPILLFQKDVSQIKLVSMGSSLGKNTFQVNIKNFSGDKKKWMLFLDLIPRKGAVLTGRQEIEILGKEKRGVSLTYEVKEEGWYDMVYYLQEGSEKNILYRSSGYPVKVDPVGEPPLVTISPTGQSPTLDGELDEQVWSRAARLEDFFLSSQEKLAKIKTTAYLAYDEEKLYLAFRCHEPDLAGMKAEREERDGLVWTDDCIEFFISPYEDRIPYYHFVLNSLATQWDEFFISREWDACWDAKTLLGENCWTAEIAIPFSQLGVEDIREETKWYFNLHRRRYVDEKELSSWSPVFDSFTDAGRFGIIIFGKEGGLQIKVAPTKSSVIGKNRFSLEIANECDSLQKMTVKVEIYNPQGEVETSLLPLSLEGGEKRTVDVNYYLRELGTSRLVFSLMDRRKKIYFRSARYPVIPSVMSTKL